MAQFADTGVKLKQVEKAVVTILVSSVVVSHSGEVESAVFEIQPDQHLPELSSSDDSGGLNGLPCQLEPCAFKPCMIHGCQYMAESVFIHTSGSMGSTVSGNGVWVNRACEGSCRHWINEWLYVVDPHPVVPAEYGPYITSGRNLNNACMHQSERMGISVVSFDPDGNLMLPWADVVDNSASGIGDDRPPVNLYPNGSVVDVAYPKPGCVGVSVNNSAEDHADCKGVDVGSHCVALLMVYTPGNPKDCAIGMH